MYKTFFLSLLCFFSSFANASCLSDQQLVDLAAQETAYLLKKVPPAFAHTLKDKKIALAVKAADTEECQATLTVTLPQTDIAEANAILDAQPAKKIMLAAQGQGVPQSVQSVATFQVAPETLAISDADQLQTEELGKLRASIELMYALLTQERAQVQPGQTNAVKWSEQDVNKLTGECTKDKEAAFCSCLAEQYAMTISPQQMDYIQYIRSNPYALATGANQAFETVKQAAELHCKG